MFKKILAIALASVCLFSSCGRVEDTLSSSMTQSEASSEIQSTQGSQSNETSSENSSRVETSSIAPETSSAVKPTSSHISSAVSYYSSSTTTTSQSITIPLAKERNHANISIYHFSPQWTTNYGQAEDDRYRELEDVFKAGYFNNMIVPLTYAKSEKLWDLCKKYDITVWISMYTFFETKKAIKDSGGNITGYKYNDINTYLKDYDSAVKYIMQDEKKWELFLGFHHEECVWRGQTNADFLTQHKELYTRYGKRNFDVFATGEYTQVEGNEQQIGQSADSMKKVLSTSLKYSTDVGFDSYSVDVREGATNGGKIPDWQQKISPNIVDGKTYYEENAKILLSLTGHKANLWLFPTSYTTSLWGGLNGLGRANEDFCSAMLEYMEGMIERAEYPGGLCLYTYTQFSNEKELGFQSHIDLADENGKQKIRPETAKWYSYSKLIRDITARFRQTSRKVLYNV
jgi:hypothetical protein